MLVVGRWPALEASRPELRPGRFVQVRSLSQTSWRRHLPGPHVEWIVAGLGLTERDLELVDVGLRELPQARLAVVVAGGLRGQSWHWASRGCLAVLSVSMALERAVAVLAMSRAQDLVVVDRLLFANGALHEPVESQRLTHRELEVLRMITMGCRNAEIACRLSISVNTVEFHLKRILTKLNTRNRIEAVMQAMALGLIASPERTGQRAGG